jgi:hypothetical protein
MPCNVGGIDRIARIIAGIAIIGAGVYLQSWWGAVGAVPLLTGAIGMCPLYFPLKLSTCQAEDK